MKIRHLILPLGLLAVTLLASGAAAEDFTFRNITLYTISATPGFDYQKHWLPLVFTFDNQFWEENRSNESKLRAKAGKVIENLKAKIATTPPDTTFTTEQLFKLGKYNRETQAFNFTPYPTYSRFKISYYALEIEAPFSPYIKTEDYYGLSKEYRIFFSNTKDLISHGIPFEPEAAEKFIHEKEEQNEDRAVYGKVTFHIVSILGKDANNKSTNLLAELDSIEVYMDKEKTTLLTSYTK